jgi:hypothetical protein
MIDEGGGEGSRFVWGSPTRLCRPAWVRGARLVRTEKGTGSCSRWACSCWEGGRFVWRKRAQWVVG